MEVRKAGMPTTLTGAGAELDARRTIGLAQHVRGRKGTDSTAQARRRQVKADSTGQAVHATGKKRRNWRVGPGVARRETAL
jgi:hypothetical protein